MTDILDRLRDLAERIEAMATDALAALGPWLAPIPSAALVARASQEHLHWSAGLGLVSGTIIEILGLTATSTALALWDYNESKRKTDPTAPFPLAAALVGFYYVSTVGLTVLLDIVPSLARFAPAIFSTLALVGTVNLALRAQHKRRVEAIQDDKQKRSKSRSGKRSIPVQDNGKGEQIEAFNLGSLNRANNARKVSKTEALNALVSVFLNDPNASYSKAGRAVGRSKSWVSGAIRELEGAGKLRKNGSGWEVVTR